MTNPLKMRRQPRQARSLARVNHILDVAEEMFISEGYQATNTNAIAVRAQVPIGSLYQFFPDKAAILFALAQRYNQKLRDSLAMIAPLSSPEEYIETMIDSVALFFEEHPGYHAIFMPLQGAIPELTTLDDAADSQLIEDLCADLPLLCPNLDSQTYQTIAFVLVKTIGNLLWLSLGQDETLRRRLLAETKRLALNYLQSYCPD